MKSEESELIQVLEEASATAQSFQLPEYLQNYFRRFPEEQKLDRVKGIEGITESIRAMEKPTIAFLGSYSSGKTYLVNHLINEKVFKSNLEPTTAVITVIRHIEDRPESWSSDHTVFTLKKGTSIRTLNREAIAGCYTLDELEQLTTYADDNLDHDAVVVFLEKDILKQCTFLDSPGIGILSEANPEGKKGPSSKEKAAHLEREQALQQMVIADADAYLLLSPVVGTCGLFADDNTGDILYHIATKGRKVATKSTFGNLIFVGTLAQPDREGLDDEDELLRKMHVEIDKQVKNLPVELRAKFDVNLAARIQLFYTLDSKQIKAEIQNIARTLRPVMQSWSEDKIQAEAEKQFLERQGDFERRKGFDAASRSMAAQLQLSQEEYKMNTAEAALEDGAKHYFSKFRSYKQAVEHKDHYEKLSIRYKREEDARESDWSRIQHAAKSDVSEARSKSFTRFTRAYDDLTDKQTLSKLLDDNFPQKNDKEGARQFMGNILSDKLNSDLSEIVSDELNKIAQKTETRLRAFDDAYVDRSLVLLDDQTGHGGTQTAPKLEGVGQVDVIFSVTDGFATAMGVIAGTTTIAASLGSTLASAAIVKVILIGTGVLHVIGIGTPIAAFLLLIPLWGWAILGLAGIFTAIKHIGDWRGSLVSKTHNKLIEERSKAISSAQEGISKILEGTDMVIDESLKTTKQRLDAHVYDVHEKGAADEDGATAEGFEKASIYYADHANVLEATRKIISAYRVNS